jgi:hypothetical protein
LISASGSGKFKVIPRVSQTLSGVTAMEIEKSFGPFTMWSRGEHEGQHRASQPISTVNAAINTSSVIIGVTAAPAAYGASDNARCRLACAVPGQKLAFGGTINQMLLQ